MQAYYKDTACDCGSDCGCESSNSIPVTAFRQGVTEPVEVVEAIDLSPYVRLTERIAKQLHEGKLKPEDLHQELIQKTYNDLSKAGKEGWGEKDFVKFGQDLGRDKTVIAMQDNMFEFSGAKTYAQLKEMNQLLYHKGQMRQWNDFKAEVSKINQRYNKNYLQAEYQTAQQAGHNARKWQQFQKDKDLYPNLQYKTVHDNRVRPAHRPLHNIIKPIDDPFWDKYYPPNGWRCRCYVIQTTAKPAGQPPEREIVKPEFQGNVGKTGKVFNDKNPFFALFGKKAREKLEALKNEVVDFTPENISDYEEKLVVKIDRSIFKLLKKKVIFTQKNLNPLIKNKGAYYRHEDDYLKIPIDARRKNSKWYAEAVIYHEFGHAIDWQTDLRFSKEIKLLRDKYKALYAKENNKRYRQIHDNLEQINKKAQLEKDYDRVEKCSATRDTLMSLNPNYGYGHSEIYFKRKGNKEAEFIAHMFENAFIGNDIFKKEMPALYNDMILFINTMKKTKP